LGVDAAWALQSSASPIVVATLDTGLTVGPDGAALAPWLAGTPVLPGADLISLSGPVGSGGDASDDNGHGTLMTTLMVAHASPGVTLLPVKVLDADRKGTESALAAGIDYAVDAGADVIAMSLAFPPGFVPSARLTTAVERARAAGAVLVAATGNDGVDEVSYPAAFGAVTAVGAVRLTTPAFWWWHKEGYAARRTGRAEYSGWGAAVDITAPGGSLDYDLNHDGFLDGVLAQGPTTPGATTFDDFLVVGTSAATAQAAGVAALWLAAGADPEAIRPLMAATARDRSPSDFDLLTGPGVLQAATGLLWLQAGAVPVLPRRWVNTTVQLVEDDLGQRRAMGLIEVVDGDGQPVAGARVVASFRGAVRHAVAGVTDAEGVALVVSLPAPAGALFELRIDKVFEPVALGAPMPFIGPDKLGKRVSVVPDAFARFEQRTFVTLSSFVATAEGAGFGPSPFLVALNPDVVTLIAHKRGLTVGRGPDPALPGARPIDTIPPDIEAWTPVPTLLARTYAAEAASAPTVFAIDRALYDGSCELASRAVAVYSDGAGFGPSPFRIGDSYIDGGGGGDEVMVTTGPGDGHLFLNGAPTTAEEIGIFAGTPGVVITTADGSACEPTLHQIADTSVLPDAVRNQIAAASHGGLSLQVVDIGSAPSPPTAWEARLMGSAFGEALFASSQVPGALTSTDIAATLGAGAP
jgi:hypothetical protein